MIEIVKEYTLKPSKAKTIKALVKLGKYDYVDPDINDTNFRLDSVGDKALLVKGSETMTSPEIIEELGKINLRPANLTELATLGYQYPEEQLQYPIMALGSVWAGPDGDRSVGYLWGSSGHRRLYLRWYGHRWFADGRFLAFRKPELEGLETLPSIAPLTIEAVIINGKTYRLEE